jgi:hypothetical protein
MHDFDVRIFLQIIGALLYITNFLLLQTHRIHATKPASLGLVVSACSTLLTAAIIGHDWGLILLEGTWLFMVTTTLVIRQRGARRRSVLEREAAVSAVPAGVVAAEPVAVREPELAGAAALGPVRLWAWLSECSSQTIRRWSGPGSGPSSTRSPIWRWSRTRLTVWWRCRRRGG